MFVELCKVSALVRLTPHIVLDALQVPLPSRTNPTLLRNWDLYVIAEYVSAAVVGLCPRCEISYVAEGYPYLNPGKSFAETNSTCSLVEKSVSPGDTRHDHSMPVNTPANADGAQRLILPSGYPLCFSAVAPWSP